MTRPPAARGLSALLGKNLIACRLPTIAARAAVIAAALLLAFAAPPSARSQSASSGAQRVDLLRRSGGPFTAALALPDGSLLAAQGSALARFVPSPTRAGELVETGRLDAGYGAILDLAPVSGHAVALAEQGLFSLPIPQGDLPPPASFAPGGGQALAARGDLIAVAAREAGLRVWRMDTSGQIAPLVSVLLPGPTLDAVIDPSKPLVYVAAGEAGVFAVDLADPVAPGIAALPQSAPARAIALTGGLLAIGGPDGRVALVDPSSAQPLLGQFAPLRSGRRMAIAGEYAYIADAQDGLKVLWLAAPDRPVQIFGEADRPAFDVALDGDTLFLASADGLRLLDASDPYRPLQLGSLTLPAPPLGLALAPDGRVFAALGEAGVAVIDAQNRSQPTLRKVIPLGGPALAVRHDEGVVYAAANSAGLIVIDAPYGGEAILAALDLPGPALDLALRLDSLFVAAGDAGLIGVNVMRPRQPAIGGSLPPDIGHSISTITISGRRAFAAQGDSFIVADATTYAHIGRLARVEAPAGQVAANDVYLYALHESQLGIYDASASAEPVFLRAYRALSSVARLAAQDGRVFAVSDFGGPDVAVLDVRFPDAPYELDNLGEAGGAGRPALFASGVVLPAGLSGLRVYSLTEGGALKPEASAEGLPDASTVSVDGARAALGGRGGWALVDASTLDRLAGGSRETRALALKGDLLAVASGDGRLALISLAGGRAETVAERGGWQGLAGLAWAELATAENGAQRPLLLAADAGGLAFIDPATLTPIRRLATPAPANGIAARGGWAYLALADGSVAAVDVGDPLGGVITVGSAPSPRPADLLAAPNGSIWALADTTLSRLDLSDPSRPALVNIAALPCVAERGFVIDGLFVALAPADSLCLFAAPASEGGTIVERSKVIAPASDLAPGWPISYAAYGASGWGWVDLPGLSAGGIVSRDPARGLLRQGDTLFVIGDALTAWRVEGEGSPRLLAELPLPAPGRAIAAAPNGDLLLSLDLGIAIARWDGAVLEEVGTLITGFALDRAAQIGGRIFAARHDGGLLVIDAADPAQPRALFMLASERGQFVHDLMALDDTRLLASWEGGVDLLDAAAGEGAPAPTLASTTPVGASPTVRIAISADGSRAAVGMADGGVALLDLSDPRQPKVMAQAALPAPTLGGIALDDQAIYAANGACGLRALVWDGAGLAERGYWRGGVAADVGLAADGSLVVGEGGGVAALRFVPQADAVMPPLPQSPSPAHDSAGVGLDVALEWGPPPDACDPVRYDAHFGQLPDPPLAGSVNGEGRLQVARLAPNSLYYWRVDVTDRQGDTTRGPTWRFTTTAADFPDAIPASPPALLAWVEDHPEVSTGLAALIAGLIGFSAWRLLRPRRQPGSPPAPPETPDRREKPDWYSTHEDE